MCHVIYSDTAWVIMCNYDAAASGVKILSFCAVCDCWNTSSWNTRLDFGIPSPGIISSGIPSAGILASGIISSGILASGIRSAGILASAIPVPSNASVSGNASCHL